MRFDLFSAISAISAMTLVAGLTQPAYAATPAPDEPDEPPAEADLPDSAALSEPADLSRAKELYREGHAKFETFDYVGAIDLWTKAYSQLEENPTNRSVRAKLLFNIAAARVAAFDIDQSISHLRQAQRLMHKYIDGLERQYGDEVSDSAESQEAAEWLERIEAKLEEAEAAEAARTPDPVFVPEPAAEPESEPDTPRDTAGLKRQAKIFTITGAVVGGVGLGLLGAMTAGIVRGQQLESDGDDRRAQDPALPASEYNDIVDDGKAMNGLAIGAGVAGGALLAAGVALIVVGQLKRKSAMAVQPSVGPRFVGLSLEARF